MDWQPIETAPRDDSEVLVWAGPRGDSEQRVWTAVIASSGQCSSAPYLMDEYYMEILVATHWMPLPEPPAD
jgi:hypothetical protein